MNNYFEGWYFKQQTNDFAIAFIPAIHSDKHGSSASLQIVLQNESILLLYPKEAIKIVNRKVPVIQLDNCHFSADGVQIEINSDGIKANGELHFGPRTRPRYDVMGPFVLMPFMECRHKIYSMRHEVSGILSINGKTIDFTNGKGYIEGDSGHSFPKRYFWTQCTFDEGSLMMSVADIPFLGRSFNGIIGIILFKGLEYRIATYLGAKTDCISNEAVIFKQGDKTLTVNFLAGRGEVLAAPIYGSMTRNIHENLCSRVRYQFKIANEVLFDFVSDCASFEYEYI